MRAVILRICSARLHAPPGVLPRGCCSFFENIRNNGRGVSSCVPSSPKLFAIHMCFRVAIRCARYDGGVDSLPPSSVDLFERLLMTSSSSKSIALSRRAVLGAGGVGLAAVLSACARTVHPPVDAATSESASASPSASSTLPSANKSYKGKVTFDNFEKNGEYVPATAEKKAQNVPKPLMPEKVQELSIDGIYALIGYWISSFNYLALTGDIEPLKKTDPSSEYYKELEPMVKLYETGRGWIYDTSEPMSVYLMTDTPTQVEGDRIRYFWRARSLVDQNAKRHLTEGDNRDKSLARAEDSQGQAMRIVVEYKEGAWFMSTQKDKDADKSTESASPSAS